MNQGIFFYGGSRFDLRVIWKLTIMVALGVDVAVVNA